MACSACGSLEQLRDRTGGLTHCPRAARSVFPPPRGNDVLLFPRVTLVMLAATLLQRRFGYYFSVNAAVSAAFWSAGSSRILR
jgi:hypothetical protein